MRRAPGGLQRDVLAVLGAASEALTPGEVRDALDAGLAYTTVMTVLARLHRKGLVSREPAGRGYAYSATADPDASTAWQMQHLLDAGVDRAGVLTRFVGTLSESDERLLRRLLAGDDGEERP